MIAFRFRLWPVADITPWGQPDDPSLTWFGLSYGWYWIEIDGHELLRYRSGATDPGPAGQPRYVDYQISRLWQDVIGQLPAILEPVPVDLVAFITGHSSAWLPDDDDPALEAAYWYGERRIDLAYLRDPPSIRCWRTTCSGTDVVSVDWLHHADSDIEFTAPTEGHVRVPTHEFVDAVRAFDCELLAAMQQRITDLERDGPPPGVRIDMDLLRLDHRDRTTWLARAINTERHTDWDTIRTGARRLLDPTKTSYRTHPTQPE